MMTTTAEDVDPIRNGGADVEAAIFVELEALKWVLRSHEFAVVDGAISYEGSSLGGQSYADRFWEITELSRGGAHS